MRIPPVVLIMLVSCALAAGCGVRFRDPDIGNEFFKSATVTGDLHAGATLTGSVSIAQRYGIDVPIACELRQGKDLVKAISTQTIPALPGGTPKSAPVVTQYSHDFTVDKPGAYKFECYTTADQDNYIIREFTVR